jgi:hypothetical protein
LADAALLAPMEVVPRGPDLRLFRSTHFAMKRLTGGNLRALRKMVNLSIAYVAQQADVGYRRLEEIESDEAIPTFAEANSIFAVLRGARDRQLRRHHDYVR